MMSPDKNVTGRDPSTPIQLRKPAPTIDWFWSLFGWVVAVVCAGLLVLAVR